MPSCRIRILCENTAGGRGLLGEHGLSMWIEIGESRVLLDTGAGGTLLPNARCLGIRPETAEAVVLSHGHYDHTGGLEPLYGAGLDCPVFAAAGAGERAWARNEDGTYRPVGMPEGARRALEAAGRLETVAGWREVVPGLWASGPIPRCNDFEDTGGPFYRENRDGAAVNTVPEDMALLAETPAGPVVLLGCAHAGVVNTLEHVRGHIGRRARLAGLLGGMHLRAASEDRIERTCRALREWPPGRLGANHCTGLAATVRLWQAMDGRGEEACAGSEWLFE
jgi:7,8-dihydropterin-6-yl-methyl-4-(beta-D-ribofuranosyl)aminobenzene 5'-phosphate synthase